MKQGFFFAVIFALMLTLQNISFAQQKPKLKDALVFEIRKNSNPGSGGAGRRFSSSNTFYFYQSGRIACQSISYDPRGKEINSKKNKCNQLNKTKINELIALAEQPDFLEAKESYRFFSGGADYGTSFSIRCFRKTGEKEIYLTNPKQSKNDIPLPQSVTTFLTKLAEIDESMRIKL